MTPSHDPVILASASPARADLLRKAGLEFDILPARVDEDEMKHSLHAAGVSASETAVSLAELKAMRISKDFPNALVIGADQMLECGQVWFDKPVDMAHAKAHLAALRGRTHSLHNAVCVVKTSAVIWHHVNEAKMTMRNFSAEFLDHYLETSGEDILHSVGAYQLEGHGAQLFNRVDGDFFSILGLPLLPLIDFLRGHKVFLA
ncbi:Maf family protein [Sneathiella chinensis]|uniref:Nucleoside triphosphate pyrophosphatase n=1 Tax=Sneathiella chinensis TaxID=349750 RepID=A0ABQ5TZS0_9PROT|nr:Maf family protein [Sneathiella chinensis]GLQ04936.1 Maf-like protein [Sneathiella chinensis]